MDYEALSAELADARYQGMSDAEAAADLNDPRIASERTSISGSEIFNAIAPSDFQGLSEAAKGHVRDVFNLGDSIDVSQGTNARAVLLAAFGQGTDTRANLAALVQTQISRAQELGLGGVRHEDVAKARAL